MRFWDPPVLIAGPCAVETDDVNSLIAECLGSIASQFSLRVVFKGSFDKANRSQPGSPRGPGLDRGLAGLAHVREVHGLPVITDVHEVWQVTPVAAVVDALQVPAFLCRQTDLLEGVGQSGLPVNIKRGQWMSPEAMGGAVAKVREGGGDAVVVTERGTFFGYGDLVVDMRSFRRIKMATGGHVLFDATHAVQQPGIGVGGTSGGIIDDVPALLHAAAAAGADGFFIETHPRPAAALSDAASQWPLERLEDLIGRVMEVWRVARTERRMT